MRISYVNNRFQTVPTFREGELLRNAGFKWDEVTQVYYTNDHRLAEGFIRHCDDSAVQNIRQQRQNIQNSIAQSASAESNMKLWHPDSIVPRPYQVAGVEYIINRKGCILADEQGLGKTGQAILAMNMRKNVECLIVCLSLLKIQWLKEIRKWMIGTVKVTIYHGKKLQLYEKKLTDHPKTTIVHIVNYDILEKHFARLSYLPINHFYADESQQIKNPEARRTQVAQRLARKATYKLFMTGTPIYNKPVDLFVPLNLIDPVRFPNFQKFKDEFCSGRDGSYMKKSVMDELNRILRSNFMIRRLANDVLKDLPEKIKDIIVLSEDDLASIVAKEQQALKTSQQKEEYLRNEVERLKDISKGNAALEAEYKAKVKSLREIKFKNFGEIAKIRKEMAIKKAPYVIQFVKEQLESDEDPQSKIVVFGHHNEVLHKIYEGLKKYKPVVITGETPDKQRQHAIKLFSEKNDTRVFLGSMGAAGTGVDGLQNSCHKMVFAELDWTPSLISQAEARLRRMGQKHTVWVYHIVADGSIDGKIAKLLVQKENVSKKILDFRPDELYDHLVNAK